MTWVDAIHGAVMVGVAAGSLISILRVNIGIRRESAETLRRSLMVLEDLEFLHQRLSASIKAAEASRSRIENGNPGHRRKL